MNDITQKNLKKGGFITVWKNRNYCDYSVAFLCFCAGFAALAKFSLHKTAPLQLRSHQHIPTLTQQMKTFHFSITFYVFKLIILVQIL